MTHTRGLSVWQPNAQMGTMSKDETIVVRGEGAYIYTDGGERLFDSSSALWYANLGHANEELARAAYAQMLELETYYIWSNFLHPRVIELADELTGQISPIPDAKVMFGAGGSDAADMAFKLARQHWQLQGNSNKRYILSRKHAYHGLHGFGVSLHGDSNVREAFGSTSLVPETGLIETNDLDSVRSAIEQLGAESIAAIVAEPIVGSGGVYPPAPGYLQGLRELCDAYDILLIFDEVITGFGRSGHWFASQRYNVVPDMLMFAKGVTCGYQPLGGVYVAKKIWAPFWEEDARYRYIFGTTYSGHATACAVALKVIEIIERDGLLGRVQDLESTMTAGLRELVEPLPTVESVRSEGLMACVTFSADFDSVSLRRRMRQRGLHIRPIAQNSIALSPPFITTDPEMETLLEALAEESAVHEP